MMTAPSKRVGENLSAPIITDSSDAMNEFAENSGFICQRFFLSKFVEAIASTRIFNNDDLEATRGGCYNQTNADNFFGVGIMTHKGHVENDVIVIDGAPPLLEGTPVTIEVSSRTNAEPTAMRPGEFRKRCVGIKDDFDQLLEDIANSLGMNELLS